MYCHSEINFIFPAGIEIISLGIWSEKALKIMDHNPKPWIFINNI
jgi:hypothetical protein